MHSNIPMAPAPQALFGRIDLDRYLTPFPAPYPAGGRFNAAGMPQVNQAIIDRQMFALDLFTALQKATGALDPITVRTNYTASSPEYNALYWLAQLAVNIVDYIDQDDYNTPFNWDPTAPTPQWVYGTELPRLVINEVYVQLDNDPSDPGVTGGRRQRRRRLTTSTSPPSWSIPRPTSPRPPATTIPLSSRIPRAMSTSYCSPTQA